MAKPRVFISSTFYDLKQIRIELDKFIESLGYEPVRNEEGDIPYGKEEELQKYCYREVDNVDILVSILGGRYGSKALTEDNSKGYSVSQMELITALKEDKQVFIFIEKNVLTEYETYLVNKDNENVSYHYVDNINIYKFIEELKSLPNNNNIKGFESADDIIKYLREQFAGLFKQFLLDSKRMKEAVVLRDIESTAKNLRNLVDYLKQENQEKGEEINKIIMFNHPIIGKLKEILKINYNFYIENEQDLSSLLNAYGYRNYAPYQWRKSVLNGIFGISIASKVFENGKLKYFKPGEWKDEYVKTLITKSSPIDNDDLPF